MSNNKVTQKMLMEMIDQMLNEKFNFKAADAVYKHQLGGTEDRVQTKSQAAKALDALAAIVDPGSTLNKSDIEYFIGVNDKDKLEVYRKFNTDVERAMYLLQKIPQSYEELCDKVLKRNITKALGMNNSQADSLKGDLRGPNPAPALTQIKNAYITAKNKGVSFGFSIMDENLNDIEVLINELQNLDNMKELSELAVTAVKEFYDFQKSVTKDPNKTLTSPVIDSAMAEKGLFPESQKAMVKKLLTGPSFADRMKQVNEISLKYNNASKATSKEEIVKIIGDDPSQILTEIMLLDLFNLLLRATTTEQARYGFEALLALIAGGSQQGATLTSSGTQGVADFVDDKGRPGSAKLYKSGAGKIDQSLANFIEAAEKSGQTDFQVHYVIGLKKQGAEQLGVDNLGRGSGSPSKNVVLEVHEPIVGFERTQKSDSEDYFWKAYIIPSGTTNKIYSGTKVSIDGLNKTLNITGGGRVRLDTSLPLGTATGQIYVTASRVETFRTYIGNIIDQQGGQAKAMLDSFKKFIEKIEESKEKSKVYIASTKPDDAQQTLNSLEESKTNFNNIKEIMDKLYPRGESIQESKKITASMLTKLFEEKFKK